MISTDVKLTLYCVAALPLGPGTPGGPGGSAPRPPLTAKSIVPLKGGYSRTVWRRGHSLNTFYHAHAISS